MFATIVLYAKNTYAMYKKIYANAKLVHINVVSELFDNCNNYYYSLYQIILRLSVFSINNILYYVHMWHEYNIWVYMLIMFLQCNII